MDNLLKDLSSLSKKQNDNKIELKRLSILKNIYDTLKHLEKKKITEIQPKIEDMLYELIDTSKVTNDLIARYIYYIYQHIIDNGINSHITDFINKYSTVLQSKSNSIIKQTSLWLLCKICTKTHNKTPIMSDLIKTLIKVIKSSSDSEIKNSCFGVISRFLNLKLPFFHMQIPDILKVLFKHEKNITNKKNIIKTLNSIVFYLNQQMLEKYYPTIIEIITKAFEDNNKQIRAIAIKTYISLHSDKIFDYNIIKHKVIRKNPNEQLKNFLEVLLYISTIFNYSQTEVNRRIKMCYLEIMRKLFILNKDYLNSSESLIIKIFDLMLKEFPVVANLKDGLNIINMQNDNDKSPNSIDYGVNRSIENLYRCYIKVIYNLTYRKTLLIHIFKKLNESQRYMDSFENSSLSFNTKTSNGTQRTKNGKKYTEYQVNAMLISLLEYSENNADIFEQIYKSFIDLSKGISVYITSSVRSFRLLTCRMLCNLAYYLPAWRISILTLVLNLSSVAHAEVVSFKNTMLYFIEENKPEYKYSLIIKKNIELLKDICNCLALILTMFSHKSQGIPIDTSLNTLSRAKNIILGNLVDEEDNPQYKSINDIANNKTKYDLNAYKESGFIIIQGLCSLDSKWVKNNSKTFFFLWNYVFSDISCDIDESGLKRDEYKDTLAIEFYIKKAAIAALRKFILCCGEEFIHSNTFSDFISKIIPNILSFFIPYNKPIVINFYNKYLLSSYQEVKMFIYDCFYLIPTDLYSHYFNSLLYPLTDEITYEGYTDWNYEHIYIYLNQIDNLMCNSNLLLDKYNKEPEFALDNFAIEKYKSKDMRNLISKSFQFAFSAIRLFVEIILSSRLVINNKKTLLKNFVTHITSIAMNKNTTNAINTIGNYNKMINIAITTYLIIKHSCKRGLDIINDDNIFSFSKMIFDLCFKSDDDDSILLLIGAEGHSYLINASQNTRNTLQYYLTESEITLKNNSNISNRENISIFYIIANIFRNVPFKDISPFLSNFINLIISNCKNVDKTIYNPFICQSIFIIMDTLVINNQIDYVRKLIGVYKVNFLFINMSNSQYFFKDHFELNSLAEIRLLIILAEIGESLKTSEYELFYIIIMKYLKDEKYRSHKIQKNFLYFTKILMKCNSKVRDIIYTSNYISFLFEKKESFYEQRLSLEIIITILIEQLKFDTTTLNIKQKMELLVNYINELYNTNRNFYFNHKIFTNNFNYIKSYNSIYDVNKNDDNINAIASLIEYNNFSSLNFDISYKLYHLIKLAKFIIRIYIEKNYLNTVPLLNMIKELVQNQLILYSSEIQKQKDAKNDSIKGDENSQSNKKTITLITIRDLDSFMHLNLKKFIIKTINNSLIKSLEKVILNNKSSLIEILNFFMGSSMVLISCEESWIIKIYGIELLTQIINKFANVMDTRIEDDSLLLQQYEAQISSCIKIIFKNNVSIKSTYKGLKLLYLFITIPICTDVNYLKRVNTMVDLNNLKKNEFSIGLGGNDIICFSDKTEHILLCKKVIFLCKLYLTLKSSNNSTFNYYDILNSKVNQIEIFAKYITPSYKKSIEDFFNENNEKMFYVLIKMLCDFYYVLTTEPKIAQQYKGYNFIYNGNSIAYSEDKLIKYGQMYIKVLALMINDKSSNGYKIAINDSEMIIKLILYYINYYLIKKDISAINDEININKKNKIEYSLNIIMLLELIDSFNKIIGNENNSIEIAKKSFNDLIKISVDLIQFGIFELYLHCILLLNNLFKKYLHNIKSSLSPEDKINIISTISKVMYYYENKTSLINGKENMLFIELSGNVIEFIIQIYNDTEQKEELNEYIYYNLKLLITSFKDFSNNNSKICAGKFFNAMMLISNSTLLSLFIIEIEQCLTTTNIRSQFDKFFVLFYMILQFVSKCQHNNLLSQVQSEFIHRLIIKNIKDKEFILIVLKSLYLGILQNFDLNLKLLVERMIICFIEERYLLNYFTDDLQNIILLFVFNCNEIQKRKEFIQIITIVLYENIEVIDLNGFCVFIMKMFNKDIEFLQSEEMQEIFNEEVKGKINAMIEMQIKYVKEQEEKKKNEIEQMKKKEEEEEKKKENVKAKELNQSNNIDIQKKREIKSSGGPKIKALKFKK